MSDAGEDPQPFAFTAPLSVCVDVKHPHAYLALGPVRRLADDLGIDVDWLPFPADPMKAPPPEADDRGTRHRRTRARYQEADIRRYATVQGLTIESIYRAPDSTPACLALLWLREHQPEHRFPFLERLFAGYWAEGLDVEDVRAMASLLEALDADTEAFRRFAAGPGPAALADVRSRLVAAGVFAVPSLIVEDEVFVGRAHLPMVRWRLTGRSGPPPI